MDKIVSKNTKYILGAACFLAGLALGFLLSPVKGGISTALSIGSYNGSYNSGLPTGSEQKGGAPK